MKLLILYLCTTIVAGQINTRRLLTGVRYREKKKKNTTVSQPERLMQ